MEDYFKWYAIQRTIRPLDTKQEWTVGFLEKQVPKTPAPINFWELVMSSCAFMCTAALIGGYVLGGAFGFVFSAMEQNEIDSNLRFRTEVRQAYKGTWIKMKSEGKAFGTFGALYMAFECPLERFLGKRDLWNSFVAGTLTGGTFALMAKSGFKGTLTGGLTCGAFCMLIEKIMHR